MKVLALLSLSFLTAPAYALLGSGNTNISQSYPCVGLDGVPIPSGGMEQQCCSGGRLRANPPAACRAGFNTMSGDAAGGAAFNISIAETTLNVASGLNGTNTDFNQVTAPTSGNTTVPPPKAVTSAMHSGGDAGGSGEDSGIGSYGSGNGPNSGSGGYGSGTGGGGGGSSGGGVGLLSGSTSGGGAKDGKNTDPNAETNSPLGGKYASNSQGGKDGFGSHTMEFGSGGSGVGVDGNGLEELGFGDEGLVDGTSGDVEGTVVDPSNYFSLTHKSDDLFKIVTRRYHKKWNKLAGTRSKGRIPTGKAGQNKPL